MMVMVVGGFSGLALLLVMMVDVVVVWRLGGPTDSEAPSLLLGMVMGVLARTRGGRRVGGWTWSTWRALAALHGGERGK